MNPPLHLVRLVTAAPRETEALRVVTRRDIQRGTPIFRAPALPTPHQIHRELPFTANFSPRLRPHS